MCSLTLKATVVLSSVLFHLRGRVPPLRSRPKLGHVYHRQGHCRRRVIGHIERRSHHHLGRSTTSRTSEIPRRQHGSRTARAGLGSDYRRFVYRVRFVALV